MIILITPNDLHIVFVSAHLMGLLISFSPVRFFFGEFSKWKWEELWCRKECLRFNNAHILSISDLFCGFSNVFKCKRLPTFQQPLLCAFFTSSQASYHLDTSCNFSPTRTKSHHAFLHIQKTTLGSRMNRTPGCDRLVFRM